MLQFRLIPFFLPHPLFLNKEPIALSCGHLSFTEIAECTARIRAMFRASQVACIFLHYPHNKQASKLSWNCHYTHTHTDTHPSTGARACACMYIYIFLSRLRKARQHFISFSWFISIILSNCGFYVTLTKKDSLTIFFPEIFNLKAFCTP